jgi:uncharacterized protein YdaU (DUF1376 family)
MKPASFNFYTNNWLGSARVSTMTPEQEGAYIRLLCYQWNSDDQTIPADDSELAVLSRLNGRWQECGKRIKTCFDPLESDPTKLRNDRLWHEFCRIEGLRSKQAAGGRAAMAHRWGKKQVSNKSLISDLKDTNGLAPSLLSVSGIDTGICIQEGVKGEKKRVELPFKSESFVKVWGAWKEHRRKIHKPMTDYAQRLALAKLPIGEVEAIKWIENAIERGWQGIYEPTEGQSPATRNPRNPVANQEPSKPMQWPKL